MRNLIWLVAISLVPLLSAQGRIPHPHPRPRPQIIPSPPSPSIPLTLLSVNADIQDGAVVTEVKAIFSNLTRGDGEADFLLPLPPGAVVHKSKLLVNGKEMSAETLGAGQARKIYQAIVARRRDPLLLEYQEWGLVRARIYPVPAGGKAEAKFTMVSLLPEAGGVREFKFPFRALKVTGQTTLAASIKVHFSRALGAVYSPTPGTGVHLKGEQDALVDWERKGKSNHDLQVFFSPAEKDYGLLPLFHRGQAAEGTFMLTLRPRRQASDTVQIPKTVNFVVDTSGSMQGKKIEQVKKALHFFINSLRPEDSFNLITFSTEPRSLFPAPCQVDKKSRAQAIDFINAIEAAGGTNIQAAMLRGLDMKVTEARMPILLFLTDGLPTVGETKAKAILKTIAQANKAKARIFVFGAGHDVDTFLLDRMAMDGGGDRNYVLETESIEVKVSSLLTALSRPALSDLRIDFTGASFKHITPARLPDLFYGRSLTMVGKYAGEGEVKITITGKVKGEKREWTFPVTLPGKPTGKEWLEPLWAQRRIAHLVEMIKLHGSSKELVDEVKRLGKTYGIVTPWTSHLVAEEADRLAHASGLRPNELRRRLADRPKTNYSGPSTPAKQENKAGPRGGWTGGTRPGTDTGKKAVELSKKLKALKAMDKLDEAELHRSGLAVRRRGGKTFIQLEGVWVDQAFKKGMKKGIKEIKAFSPEYFQLLNEHPKAARWLSGGGAILILINNIPYHITP